MYTIINCKVSSSLISNRFANWVKDVFPCREVSDDGELFFPLWDRDVIGWRRFAVVVDSETCYVHAWFPVRNQAAEDQSLHPLDNVRHNTLPTCGRRKKRSRKEGTEEDES